MQRDTVIRLTNFGKLCNETQRGLYLSAERCFLLIIDKHYTAGSLLLPLKTYRSADGYDAYPLLPTHIYRIELPHQPRECSRLSMHNLPARCCIRPFTASDSVQLRRAILACSEKETSMSLQAYLDNIEIKTGDTL